MIPLVDMHCHLVAGADDGPRTLADAVEMCNISQAEGVGAVLGLAHQNEYYPDVTPAVIRAGIKELSQALAQQEVPVAVAVYPGAEVMVTPDLLAAWEEDRLLSVADRKQYLLIELPHGVFVDLRDIVYELSRLGVRTLLAHPEQVPEYLYGNGVIEQLVELGCVTVVSSANVVDQQGAAATKRLRDWFRRGLVHLLGSDGHSPRRRPPLMAEAYRRIVEWVGEAEANRIGALNGLAILQGLPLKLPPLKPKGIASWLPRFLSAAS